MRNIIFISFLITWSFKLSATPKTIHIFVSLCDNINQGIVPVPAKLGNGQSTKNNLYWGAMYGVKSYFKRSEEWIFIQKAPSTDPHILETILFKHRTENVYLLAQAFDGSHIKTCIKEFLLASNGQNPLIYEYDGKKLGFGGSSQLVCYVGHDGLMEFDIDLSFQKQNKNPKDVIILACYSKEFFSPYVRSAEANPLLWTTHLMSPEAYTLLAACEGWVNNEQASDIEIRAEKAYHKYQKCGMKGARNLFTTGF